VRGHSIDSSFRRGFSGDIAIGSVILLEKCNMLDVDIFLTRFCHW